MGFSPSLKRGVPVRNCRVSKTILTFYRTTLSKMSKPLKAS